MGDSVQRSGGLTEARTIQRKIRKALLSCVWVLMFLVWAEHCQSLRAEDSNDAAEDVGLFVVDLNQFGATSLDVINGFPDVDKFQALRQRGVAAFGTCVKDAPFIGKSASSGIARSAIWKYIGSSSIPILS